LAGIAVGVAVGVLFLFAVTIAVFRFGRRSTRRKQLGAAGASGQGVQLEIQELNARHELAKQVSELPQGHGVSELSAQPSPVEIGYTSR